MRTIFATKASTSATDGLPSVVEDGVPQPRWRSRATDLGFSVLRDWPATASDRWCATDSVSYHVDCCDVEPLCAVLLFRLSSKVEADKHYPSTNHLVADIVTVVDYEMFTTYGGNDGDLVSMTPQGKQKWDIIPPLQFTRESQNIQEFVSVLCLPPTSALDILRKRLYQMVKNCGQLKPKNSSNVTGRLAVYRKYYFVETQHPQKAPTACDWGECVSTTMCFPINKCLFRRPCCLLNLALDR
ncbi:hypothetical protein CSKR_100788 [Clonorchis sinensis]|uniref:Uncharacterized protein n=1 Tax=Clonorchis sinensis TaxID=79923 RepID=A0A419QG61_CLOSI|nr:hypothetical protein CSKR_100788 [Clonorchis sinensis]